MRTNSQDRLRGLTPSQRGLVGCKLSLLLLCVHVEQRLQCGKIREHIDAGLGSFMTYVQVGRPEPPWHTEQVRSEEHTSELQSRPHLVCRLLLEKKKKTTIPICVLTSEYQ